MASPNRVAQLAGVRVRPGNAYAGANPSGPAGSATMTFAAVISLKRTWLGGAGQVFGRRTGTGGWMIYVNNSNVLTFYACNATPAFVITPATVIGPNLTPLVLIARYAQVAGVATLEGWYNGVSTGATALGAGYAAAAAATCVGCFASTTAEPATHADIHECVMLDGYDVVASYSTALGTGAAGLTAQWRQDLAQGRYLTDPTGSNWGASTANWSARNAALGLGGCVPSWIDRSTNAYVQTRILTPQSSGCSARFQ